MKKILVGIGDAHLRNRAFYKKGLKDFINWIDQILPDSKKEDTEIILAGDILHRVYMLPLVSALALDLFEILHRKASTVYAILGNHDYGLNKYKVVNSQVLLERMGVVVINKFCDYITKNGFNLCCLPWVYGSSHAKVQKYIEENTKGKSYDALVTHWELESVAGSPYIDISSIDTKAYFCGHIHSHDTNPQYLGSILPNSVAENKDYDHSVIRLLAKDMDTGNVKQAEMTIPSFLTLKKCTIQSLTDLKNLEVNENVFYKICHSPIINDHDVYVQARLLGLHVYKTEPIREDEEAFEPGEFKELSIDKKYTSQDPKDILTAYKDKLGLTDEEYTDCLQIIEEVASRKIA